MHFVFSSDTIDCVVSLGADYFGALGGAVMARCAICDKGVHTLASGRGLNQENF